MHIEDSACIWVNNNALTEAEQGFEAEFYYNPGQ